MAVHGLPNAIIGGRGEYPQSVPPLHIMTSATASLARRNLFPMECLPTHYNTSVIVSLWLVFYSYCNISSPHCHC